MAGRTLCAGKPAPFKAGQPLPWMPSFPVVPRRRSSSEKLLACFALGCLLLRQASAIDSPTQPASGQLVVGQNADGRLEIFRINEAGELQHRRQVVLYGDWSPWSSLGRDFTDALAVAKNADGTLEVFAVASETGELKSLRQKNPNSPDWGGWNTLGGRVLAPVTVAQNLDGRLEVFAVDRDTLQVRHAWQIDLEGGWSPWMDLHHSVRNTLAISRNRDGRLELFGQDAVTGNLLHCWQTTPNGVNNWSGWGRHWPSLPDENSIVDLAATYYSNRALVLFVNKTNGGVSYVFQVFSNANSITWSAWMDLQGDVRPPLAVAQNADGRLELFAVGQKQHLFHCEQLAPSNLTNWTSWQPMERETDSGPALARNPDGTLEVFTLSRQDPSHINRRRQLFGSREWLAWSDLEYSTVQYVARTWQSDEGLPFNQVQAIAQTRNGYLWIGTREGLARFDGLEFTRFDSRNTPSMLSSSVTSLLVDHSGVLWVGTAKGLLRLRDGAFSRIELQTNQPQPYVTSLRDSRDGALWVGTTSGVTMLRESRCMTLTTNGGLPSDAVNAIEEDQDANIWLATSGGLARWHDKLREVYTISNGLPNSSLHTVCRDGHGGLWLGSNGGLISFRDGKFICYNSQRGLSDPFVTAICEDREANLWVGTYGGLNRFRETRFFGEPTSDGLPYDKVNALFEDHEGNLWVGSRDGLTRLTRRRFFSYTKRQGLTHNNVMSVLEDKAGNLWIGTWGGGLNVWNRDRITAYSTADGLPHDQILSLCESADGSLWLGADHGGGLIRFKDNRFHQYFDPKGLLKSAIRVLHEDRTGTLWVGTARGLTRFNDGSFAYCGKVETPDEGVIRAMWEDSSGKLWFGTEGGLTCWAHVHFAHYGTREGLSDDAVLALYEDRDQNLWVGTAKGGLNRFRNGHFTAYTKQQGLFSDEIFSILEDDAGWLWFSCGTGIFRVNKQDLNAFDEGKVKSITCIAYGKSDGLESTLCNGVAQPSAWKTKDGKLWFATTKGLVAVDPEVKTKVMPPPVYIEQVLADRRPLFKAAALPDLMQPEPGFKVPPGRGELEFHFVAMDLQAPEKTRFRYRLEGVDSDWIEAGIRRIAHYNNIYPGHYRFHVLGCNSDGVWNETATTAALFLEPHFWQTLWFRGLGILALLGSASGTARYLTKKRMQLKLAFLERQHAIEKERGRIAKDIHDDLGSSLTQIMMLGERTNEDISRPAELAGHARKIVNSARAAVQALDEIVWAVNPENDTLDGLVGYINQYANQLFENSSIKCRLEMPVNLPPLVLPAETRHDLFLATKEGFNNVLKHSGASELHVSITATERLLEIVVQDNGHGFDPTARHNGTGGNGLGNMRQRMNDIGGDFCLETNAGRGTRLKFIAPLA